MRYLYSIALASMAALASPGVHAQTVAQAEQTVSRFEAGVQWTDIAFVTCPYRNNTFCPSAPPHVAVGPALAVNLNRNFAVDASLAVMPAYDKSSTSYIDGSVAGGRGLEFLAGPRAELRNGKLGIFVAARVGMLNWSHVAKNIQYTFAVPPSGSAPVQTTSIIVTYGGGFYFAGEAATGIDYYFTPRTHLRVEFADQLIDYEQAQYAGATSAYPQPSAWDSNATLRTGVFVGFGRNAGRQVQPLEVTPPHRFFNKPNLALLGASLLAQTADAITTQRFLHHGYQEANGLAQPFVDQGWPGQIGAAVIVNSLEVGVMYALHRMGHHRMERAAPVALATASAYAAFSNQRSY